MHKPTDKLLSYLALQSGSTL